MKNFFFILKFTAVTFSKYEIRMVPSKVLGRPWLQKSKYSNIKHRKPQNKNELKDLFMKEALQTKVAPTQPPTERNALTLCKHAPLMSYEKHYLCGVSLLPD